MEFLSTPSARRATLQTQLEEIQTEISIHALREEGDFANLGEQAILKKISIHALREEGDIGFKVTDDEVWEFLSTPSARRATKDGSLAGMTPTISIHALREEGDAATRWTNRPRSRFLSTPSARRATIVPLDSFAEARKISIHALREEGDESAQSCPKSWCDFYPRPPRGGRRPQAQHLYGVGDFYPRPPRGGRRSPTFTPHKHKKFLSTPSARRATIT